MPDYYSLDLVFDIRDAMLRAPTEKDVQFGRCGRPAQVASFLRVTADDLDAGQRVSGERLRDMAAMLDEDPGPTPHACPVCRGFGRVLLPAGMGAADPPSCPCPACWGTGIVWRTP